jgi:antirestriction protein ArdC
MAELLREDDRAIVRGVSGASKAADYLLAFRPAEDVESPAAADHLLESDRQAVSAR